MDERLKHLKESMDRTVLKNGSFRPDEKQKILRTIQNQQLKRVRRKRKFGAGFAIAISFCLLVGLSWVVYSQLQDHPKSVASKSTKMHAEDYAQNAGNEQKSKENSDNAVHPFFDSDIKPYKSVEKKDAGPDKPFYTYVVLNNYYYKETGEMVSEDKLGQEIGQIKRTGEWAVKRSGDSNDIPQGAIYAIHGKDPAVYIAAKGSIVRNGQMEVGYLVFKKFVPVEKQ